MHQVQDSAPPPDLRIVPTDHIFPHEEPDSQRAEPLIERLKEETHIINPPIVAPMDTGRYVVLDGANRCSAFLHLEYPHLIVQVTDYDSGYVVLESWQHIISGWHIDTFLDHLDHLTGLEMIEGLHSYALAHLYTRDERVIAIMTPSEAFQARNYLLREIVSLYQKNAVLNRTALDEPEVIWSLYPEAKGLMVFPEYKPKEIVQAAQTKAYLPPGISRHIIHGRAIRVNYPLAALRDPSTPLEVKNEQLQNWLRDKLRARQVRYYAEATYQFDE